jgi:import receptor subunit TOM20
MRTSSVLSLTGATLIGGLIGYAAYFDYKRRNDPEFRRKLKKDAKRTSRELKKRSEDKQKYASDLIQKTVDELNRPGVLPTSPAEKEEV